MTRRVGVVELSLGGLGPRRGFVFESHRLALSCWAELSEGQPLLLVSMDRHFDTVPPQHWPGTDTSSESLEPYAREQLDVRNFDHILAAMRAQVVGDAILVARAKPVGAVTSDWEGHALITSATLDGIAAEWGSARASPEGKRAYEAVVRASAIVLDVDIDCFTSPSDAEPTTVVPWPIELIREFVRPKGSQAFWEQVLAKCVGLTVAKESGHCGGLVAGGRLFEAAAQVLFVELLKTDLP